MAQNTESIKVSLPEILDLALGTPEVGSVNFNILHNFLNILLNQLNLQNTKVEYRDDNAHRIKTVLASLKSESRPYLHEYSITGASENAVQTERSSTTKLHPDVSPSAPATGDTQPSSPPPQAATEVTPNLSKELEQLNDRVTKVETNLVYINDDVTDLRNTYSSLLAPAIQPATGPQSESTKISSTDVAKKPVVSTQQSISAVDGQSSEEEIVLSAVGSNSNGKLTEKKVVIAVGSNADGKSSEKIVVSAVGSNADGKSSEKLVVTAVGSNGTINKTPSVKVPIKRGPSVIAGVDLKELNNDVVELNNDVTELKNDMTLAKQDIVEMRHQVDQLAHNEEYSSPKTLSTERLTSNIGRTESAVSSNINSVPGTPRPQSGRPTPPPPPPSVHELVHPSRTQQITTTGSSASITANTEPAIPTSPHSGSSTNSITVTEAGNSSNNDDLVNNGSETVLRTSSATGYQDKNVAPISRPSSHRESKEKISGSPGHVQNSGGSENEIMDAVRRLENVFQKAIERLEARVDALERNMENHLDVLGGAQEDSARSIPDVQEINRKIQGIQADMQRINQTAGKLAEETEERQSRANVLMEQIELLKTIKADKEDLEDALADKADSKIVDRKVSYDHFDTACDDLARGLEDAILKLTRQESVWHEAFDTVQQEIDNKLDKVEISPIREFVNNRLQVLQNKIKQMADKKRENEAAGTKKILTGLQCISCDKNVVMRMDQGSSYRINPMPNRQNIKPYLTYDLDRVRKQRRKLPGTSTTQLPGALHEMVKQSKQFEDDLPDKPSRGHLCNRYCGGSHTVTTPQQRVMRTGPFMTQWGPEAVQVTEGLIRGTDGQFYHSKPQPPGAAAAVRPDVCGPGGNVCCGGYNQRSYPPQVERQGFDSSIANQRRSTSKDQRQMSTTRPPRRVNSKKVSKVVQDTRPLQMLLEGLLPSAPPETMIDDEEEFIENNRILEEDELEEME